MDIGYRTRQFFHALSSAPSSTDIDQIRPILTPTLLSLFLSMQPGEIAHSLKIWQKLIQTINCPQEVQVAALLHDVGKTLHPLSLWERVVIVLARTFFPRQASHWGKETKSKWQKSWRRPFVVAENHPEWGARMAEQAGASPVTVLLIRHHQPDPFSSQEHIPLEIQPYLEWLIQLDNKF